MTLTDACGKNYEQSSALISDRIKEYGAVPDNGTPYLIGGTATSLAFMLYGDEKYDREKQNGYFLSCEELYERIEEFFACSPEELAEKRRIDLKRARVIPFGAAALYCCIKALGANGATLSEDDNLDGYYLLSQGTKAYEK